MFWPAPGSLYPPGPPINQLYTGYKVDGYTADNSDGYTSEQERKWMKEWEDGRDDSDSDEDESDSVGSDLARLQKGQLWYFWDLTDWGLGTSRGGNVTARTIILLGIHYVGSRVCTHAQIKLCAPS